MGLKNGVKGMDGKEECRCSRAVRKEPKLGRGNKIVVDAVVEEQRVNMFFKEFADNRE